VSQIYRRDDSSFDNGTASSDQTTQNALLNDVALAARRRGERFDFASRVSAGYALDMLEDGPGNQSRVSLLFAKSTTTNSTGPCEAAASPAAPAGCSARSTACMPATSCDLGSG